MHRLPWRTVTIQGPSLAAAMVHGRCLVLGLQSRLLPEGWYYVHVGANPNVAAHVCRDEGANGSSESDCLVVAIIGQVRLGRIIRKKVVPDPWSCAALGDTCRAIEEAVAFVVPVLGVSSKSKIWYIVSDTLQSTVQAEQMKSTRQAFAHFPNVPFETHTEVVARPSVLRRWSIRLPRKRRSDYQVTKSGLDTALVALATRRRMERSLPPIVKAPTGGKETRHAHATTDASYVVDNVAPNA